MKVKEVLAKLKALDPEQDVLCYCEDERDLPQGHRFRLFEIISIEVRDAEMMRLEDKTPSLEFGKTSNSQPQVLIDIISDF